jgi:hypothetical protein
LATVLPETHQGYAVWLLVVVEICNDESLTEALSGEVATPIGPGRRSPDAPMLGKKEGRRQRQCQEADLEKAKLHSGIPEYRSNFPFEGSGNLYIPLE